VSVSEIKSGAAGVNGIIELDPGPPCVVRFKEKGRRFAVDAPIRWLYQQVLTADAERKMGEKKRAKDKKWKAKRGLLLC
jgi:hypothetical protein